MTQGQKAHDGSITSDRKSKRAWSDYVLYISFEWKSKKMLPAYAY